MSTYSLRGGVLAVGPAFEYAGGYQLVQATGERGGRDTEAPLELVEGPGRSPQFSTNEAVNDALDKLRVSAVSLPIAIGLWLRPRSKRHA